MASQVTLEPGSRQSGLPSPHSTHSYWHKDPSPVLLGHRTTPDLPGTADVLIIGSGITGACAARALLHDLRNTAPATTVLMLEAREACWGATGRNGGMCKPRPYSYPERLDVPRFQLANLHFLRDLVATHAIPCEWRALPGGAAHVCILADLFANEAAQVRRAEREAPDLAALVELIDAAEPTGRARLAQLRTPTAAGAVVLKETATLWPYKLVAWILETLLAENDAGKVDHSGGGEGVTAEESPQSGSKLRFNLQTNTPATSLQRSRDEDGTGWQWVVTTPRGRVRARQVLLATNAYTSALLPGFADLVVPVRQQAAALLPPTDQPAVLDSCYLIMGTPGVAESGDSLHAPMFDQWVQQRPGGEFVCCAANHLTGGTNVGDWRDDFLSSPMAKWIRDKLHPVPLDLQPAGEHGEDGKEKTDDEGRGAGVALDATHEWTGILASSRDGCCWVGEVPTSLLPREADRDGLEEAAESSSSGLWMCAAYDGNGMPVAPLAARAVARAMVGLPMTADGDEAPFPERFLLTEERVRRARKEHAPILKPPETSNP